MTTATTNPAAAESYNAADHLVKIKSKDGSIKDYYPAAWRLYELSLKYPNANFASEIYHMDNERDFVIVKVRLYLGPDYEMSPKKAEAFKQGKLSLLDKVETGAKARAARDFGVGTEHALDFAEAEDEPQPDLSAELRKIKDELSTRGFVSNREEWAEWKRRAGANVPDTRLTVAHLAKLRQSIDQASQQEAS